MTNAEIIFNHSVKLLEDGIIKGTGEYCEIEHEDGSREKKELPEAIHTFAAWKERGRSVKKGEKAVADFCIWKSSVKMLDTDTGDAENDKINAAINAEGGEKSIFMKRAFFFTFDQTEPEEERKARADAKRAAKAEKKAARAEKAAQPAAEIEPETQPTEEPAPEIIAEAAPAEPEPEAAETAGCVTSAPHYYEINEDLARRHKENISFFDYKPNSATNEYRAQVDHATEILNAVKDKCKTQEQRDHAEYIYDKYCKVLAAAINKDNEIGTRCPSILIAGGSNFPVRKKEKQVAAWDANMKNFDYADELLNKLRGVCYQAIRSDDPEVVDALKLKLERMEAAHADALERNKEARKAGQPSPVPAWWFQNDSANIKRTRERIAQLEAVKAAEDVSEENELFRYEESAADMRIRFYFDGKPDADTIKALKDNGFRWAPSVKAWQRQLTDNGRRAADRVKKALAA